MILALDIGKTTAWARSDGTSGHRVFGDDDHGLALSKFRRWLGRMLDDEPPIYLAVERAFVGSSNNPNLRLTGAMELEAHSLAAERDIPRTDRSAGQVRKFLLGFGRLPPNEDSKAQRTRDLDKLVLAAVRARGFAPASEHEADACGLLCCVEQRMPLGVAA